MNSLYHNIASYYADKLAKHGQTPKGVDWNDKDSQNNRFTQLLRIVHDNQFSLGDVGCGFGSLFEYMQGMYQHFYYHGYDLSEEMIQAALSRIDDQRASFSHICSVEHINEADYMVASGIFNVKMQHECHAWEAYIMQTLGCMHEKSAKGFSFNMLTQYSDAEHMREDLYYADPMFMFDYCKRNFSKHVALLHDYGLYEFTILVRKGAG